MDQIEYIEQYLLSYKPWLSILIAALSSIIYKQIHRIVINHMKRRESSTTQIGNLELLFNVSKHVLAVFIFIIVLNINGVNVSSMVAGLGVTGIIVGFALQDVMKDWFMGISIVWDNYFSVGDIVSCNGATGKVVEFNLKVTKIRDIVTGNLVVISNRNISQVTILSEWLDIDVPGSYEVPFNEMEPVLNDIIKLIKKINHVHNCEYIKITEFAESLIKYRIRVYCKPEYRYSIGRKCNSIVQQVYEDHHLQIPFNQLDVHVKS